MSISLYLVMLNHMEARVDGWVVDKAPSLSGDRINYRAKPSKASWDLTSFQFNIPH